MFLYGCSWPDLPLPALDCVALGSTLSPHSLVCFGSAISTYGFSALESSLPVLGPSPIRIFVVFARRICNGLPCVSLWYDMPRISAVCFGLFAS